jgi:hypothetical protein
VPNEEFKFSDLWVRAIKVSSPKMLRGVVGAAFFTYGLAWIPDIPANDIDLWLQYGFFGGTTISALTLIYGMITGR